MSLLRLCRNAALCLLLLAPSAFAAPGSAGDALADPFDESPPPQSFFAARVGYALPFGTITHEGTDPLWLYDVYNGVVPFWLEGGYRLTSNLFLGAYGQLAPAQIHGRCDCSGSDLRLGLNLYYHLYPETFAKVWFALGLGYERTEASVAGQFTDIFSGPDASFQAGADYDAGPLSAGPFVALTMGEYLTESVNLGTGLTSRFIEDRSLHFWFQIGLRVRFEVASRPTS